MEWQPPSDKLAFKKKLSKFVKQELQALRKITWKQKLQSLKPTDNVCGKRQMCSNLEKMVQGPYH
jgi:hypothetical protein